MRIGIASPVSLRLLTEYVDEGDAMPEGYSFPLISLFVKEYLRRGYSVSLFALDPSIHETLLFRGRQLTIHIGRLRPRARHRALDFFAVERADLLAAMNSDPCDIIHAHWTYEFALAALASGVPCLVTAHDAPWRVLRYMPNAYRLIRLLMAYSVALRAAHLTAVSPDVADHFKHYLFHRGGISIVPNGLPDDFFKRASSRRVRGSAGGPLTFATVLMGWGGRKNGQAALRAFKKVYDENRNTKLLMFGYGHGNGEAAQMWALRHGLEQSVEFAGAIPHPLLMERLSQEVDVLVHPALEEANPVSIIEAMALGIPVIGGDKSGGVPFTLEYGKAGVLVDVRDPERIADAMRRLAADHDGYERLARTAYASAHQRFHVTRVIDAYVELYHAILTGKMPACTTLYE